MREKAYPHAAASVKTTAGQEAAKTAKKKTVDSIE
jgi:hypothetical protein